MEEKMEKKIETQGKNPENRKSQEKPKAEDGGKIRSSERVALKPDIYSRTEQWLSQIDKHTKGVRITRNDLVNFILLQHAPTLSEDELSTIGLTHYNELRFYSWAIKTVREAQARGEGLTVAMLEKQYKIPKP